jgi:predicted transcriptional regulator of viral defense system
MLIDEIKEKIGEKIYISTKELIELGAAKSSISYLVSSGKLKRVSRGIYSLEDDFADVMFLLHSKYKSGVFSHESALYLHTLTDQIPEIHTLSVARNYSVQASKDYKVQFKYIDKKILNLGVEMKKTDMGNEIPVYNIDRTICDIIRSDSKMDPYVVNNAIRQYMETGKLSMLMIYAAQMGIEKKVYRKLEVLL